MVRGTLWCDYILVGLIESGSGETILRRVLPAVEQLTLIEGPTFRNYEGKFRKRVHILD